MDIENIEAFCYLNIEDYDKAIELYKEKKMYNKVGDIYFDKLHDYENAFEYYKEAQNITYAIKSLSKSDKKGNLIRLFEYINEKYNCIQLGLSDYYDTYKKYINNLFINRYTKKRYIKNIFNKKEEGKRKRKRKKYRK